jgi:nucleoside-diphosphate-sugar epimerase
MIILITGSEGYIGKNLSKYLINKGFKVYGIDKKSKNKVDIMDKKKLNFFFKKIKPTIVVHLAARTDLKGNTIRDYNENIIGTKNLIDVCNVAKSVKRVIFASTMLVHNIRKKNFFKKKKFDPITKYGESKAIMEHNIQKCKKNFSWCIIRPTTIWGEKMNNHMKLFLKLIKLGLYFNINYKKPILKSYGHVTNSCYQISKLINAKNKLIDSKIFYICDYNPIEMNNWSDQISLKIRKKRNIKISYNLIKFFARIGDLFVRIGLKNFPIQTFRLRNILTGYYVENENLRKIANKLPYDFNKSIKNFVNANIKF